MSIKKKAVISVISVVLVIALVTGGILAAKNANAKTVLVVPVSDMSMGMYNEESIEGQIATSVTQKVKLDKDSIIEKVYVSQGDHVRRGDKLISFDMTLKEMELEIAILTRQQQQQNLKKAKERLASLQNGGPIEEETSSGTSLSPGGGTDEDKAPGNSLFGDSLGGDENEPDDLDTSEAPGGNMVTTNEEGTESSAIAYGIAIPPMGTTQVMAAAFPSWISFEAGPEEVPDFTPMDPSEGATETPTPTPTPSIPPSEEGNNGFYTVLTSIEDRQGGTGTKEDPFVFLCSSATGEVLVKGSFLNEAAGYDAEGIEIQKEGGYWFRLEFHKDDRLNEEDSSQSLIGYYVRNGGLLKNPMDPTEEIKYTLDQATDPGLDLDPEQVVTPTPTPEPEEPDDGDYDWGDDWDDGDSDDGTGTTREQAIKEQKRQIKEIEILIKASDIKISRLQRSLEKKTVVSAVNGTVTKMGDPVTGTYEGDAFMEIQSDGGFYVKGSISELMLESIKEGDVLNCTSYESGNSFQAEITEISEYPGDSSGGYYGSGNTNASFYPFIAVVSDDVQLSNGEGVNIMLSGSQAGLSDAINITQAFVRSENGQYYVYKDDNGKLKKQIVEAKVSTDGYSVEILSGLTLEDKISFPYGKEVVEGAKTREGTMDEFYGGY